MTQILEKNRRGFWQSVTVFVLLPCCLVCLLWQSTVKHQLDSLNRAAFKEMRKDLERLRREGDDRFYLQRQLNFAYGTMAEEPLTATNIDKYLQTFKNKGLGFINFRFFDAGRRLIQLQNESDGFRAMAQRIFEALSQPETEGSGALLVKYRSFFNAFLGAINPEDLANDKSVLLKVIFNGRPGYFYWNTFYSDAEDRRFLGGMLAWMTEEDIFANLAMRSLLDQKNAEGGESRVFGLLDLAQPESLSANQAGKKIHDLSALRSCVIDMRQNFATEKVFADNLLAIEQIAPEKFIYCLAKTQTRYYENISLILKLLLMLTVIFATRFIFNFHLARSFPPPEFCRHSFFVMFYTVLLPVLCFLLASYQYLSLQRQMLQQQTREKLENYIEAIDANYAVAVDKLEKTYHGLARAKAAQNLNQAELHSLVDSLFAKNAVSRVFFINRDGHVLFDYPETRLSNDLIKKLVSTAARRIFAARRGYEQNWKNKVNDMMVESLAGNLSEVFGEGALSFLRPFETFDKISEFWFANRRYHVFSTFVETANKNAPNLMIVWQDTTPFSESYLRKLVTHNLETGEAGQAIKLAMVPRDAAKLPFPGEFSKYPFSVQMTDRVLSTETRQFAFGDAGGESWLIVASSLKSVPEYVLFAMSPAELIEAKIRLTAMQILLAAFLCVFIAYSYAKARPLSE
ncbi:MAG: hypothetical protein EOM80_11455 [Erysipelotrichia bacterium]|nr:hypothetical protein [Erysipelotrichia bacterium]